MAPRIFERLPPMEKNGNQFTRDMTLNKCECCGGDNLRRVSHKRGYDIEMCADCGLYFVSPQPSDKELEERYSTTQGYFATAQTDLSQIPGDKVQRLHDLICSFGVKSGKFLDIGCANGQILYGMKKLGWSVTGNDLNDGALEIARSHQLNVIHGTLEQCNFENGTFDAINIGDLIEHVRSPRRLMTEVYRILRPGGVVVIRTPNAESGLAKTSLALSRLTGFPWVHSEAPYHLFDFSPRTLSKLLGDIGFDTESVKCQGSGSFFYLVGASGYFDDLKRDLKRSGSYRLNHGVWRTVPKLMFVSAVIFPLWLWGKARDRILNSGRSMLVVAKKPAW